MEPCWFSSYRALPSLPCRVYLIASCPVVPWNPNLRSKWKRRLKLLFPGLPEHFSPTSTSPATWPSSGGTWSWCTRLMPSSRASPLIRWAQVLPEILIGAVQSINLKRDWKDEGAATKRLLDWSYNNVSASSVYWLPEQVLTDPNAEHKPRIRERVDEIADHVRK